MYIFMLVERFVQLLFCLDKADKPQGLFYFLEIKLNCENIVHLEVCKVNVKILLT